MERNCWVDANSERQQKNSFRRVTRGISPTVLFLSVALVVVFFCILFPGTSKAEAEPADGEASASGKLRNGKEYNRLKIAVPELSAFILKEIDGEWDKINQLFQVGVVVFKVFRISATSF